MRNGQSEQVMDFTPVESDVTSVPPMAPAGEWQATCNVKKSKTKPEKGGFPMLILEWTLDSAADEDNESFEGATVADFIVFFPDKHKAARPTKTRRLALYKHMGIDPALEPTKKSSWDDLEELIEALDGQKATIWTYIQKDKESGEEQTRISYRAPGNRLTLPAAAAADDDEDETEETEEEETPPPPKATVRAVATQPPPRRAGRR